MPESFGKRKRRDVKARKAADREERRVARNQRKSARAAGLLEPGPPIQAAEPEALGLLPGPPGAPDDEAEDRTS